MHLVEIAFTFTKCILRNKNSEDLWQKNSLRFFTLLLLVRNINGKLILTENEYIGYMHKPRVYYKK